MPRGGRTGPVGAGPMSGRGAGFCAGFNVAGFQTTGGGFGRGCGRGFGIRSRVNQSVPFVQNDELTELKAQMDRIEKQLNEPQLRS